MFPLCCLITASSLNMYWWCCRSCHTSCLADCVVTSYFPIPITNGITIIKLAEFFYCKHFKPVGWGGRWRTITAGGGSSLIYDVRKGEIVVLTEQQSTYAWINNTQWRIYGKRRLLCINRMKGGTNVDSSLSLFNIILYPYSQLQYCDIACMHAVLFAMMHPTHKSRHEWSPLPMLRLI